MAESGLCVQQSCITKSLRNRCRYSSRMSRTASISSQADIWERCIFLVERCMHAFKVAPKHPHHLNCNLLFKNWMCIYQYNAILQHRALDVIKECFYRVCYNCTLTSRNTNTLSFISSLTYLSKHLMNCETADTLFISCVFHGLTLLLSPLSLCLFSISSSNILTGGEI